MSRWLEMGIATARKIIVAVVGVTVVLLGVAMMVLPGPAMVVIPLGLAILGLEFAWARRWLRRIRETAAAAAERVRNGMGNGRRGGAPGPERASEGSERASEGSDRAAGARPR